MSEYYDVFRKNIERVDGLNSLYTKLKNEKHPDGKENKLTDILRAEVVLLHSSFEEYFRNILIQWLPIKAGAETLHKISIVLKDGKKSEKIYLDNLLEYRGKKIDDIISESIKANMELTSFNNQREIRTWCDKLCISLDDFPEINDIDKAVMRRHKIVHEADVILEDNKKPRLSPIKSGDVSPWIDAYKKLVDIIENRVKCWEDEL